jgi:hypothetical protein
MYRNFEDQLLALVGGLEGIQNGWKPAMVELDIDNYQSWSDLSATNASGGSRRTCSDDRVNFSLSLVSSCRGGSAVERTAKLRDARPGGTGSSLQKAGRQPEHGAYGGGDGERL